MPLNIAASGRRVRHAVIAAVLPAAACEYHGPTAPRTTVDRIELVPSSVTVQPNESADFTAVALDAQGDTVEAIMTWSATGGTMTDLGLSGKLHRGQYVNASCGRFKVIAMEPPGSVADTSLVDVLCAAPVLVGAGDIAVCGSSGDEATADLLDAIEGTVFTAGDNVYSIGTPTEFANCYDPSWGRHRSRTRPVAGNHDYGTAGAAGYFGYFGAAAGDPARGYYSYDLGTWHIVVLNSNVSRTAGSEQDTWLRADLAASSTPCTLALWHHPRFTSGWHGNDASTGPFWDALYEYNAEVVVAGHDHNYERFAPQTPRAWRTRRAGSGNSSPARAARACGPSGRRSRTPR